MARLPRDSRSRATVFVVTLAVVVAGVSVGPALVGPDPGESPEFAVDRLVPERAPATGEPSIESREAGGVVLVDTAHFNRFDPDEMEPLLATITAAGYEVDLLETDENLDESLSRADAYVVIDPGRRYTEAEAARVEWFVERGGRLLLVGEPAQSQLTGGLGAIAPMRSQMSPLSSQFGIEFGEAYLFNMATNDGNHQNIFARPTGASVVTSGLSQTAFYTASALHLREGQAVLVAGDGTRNSRTDATGTYAVAAVNGNVLALGDSTFIQHGNYNVVDNEQLLTNVVRFLVEGDKRRTIRDYPAVVGEDPTIHYTGPALLPAAQSLAGDLRADGERPTLRLQRRGIGPEQTAVLVTTFDFLERRGELGTGIRASNGRVQVGSYESNAAGIVVVRAPADGYDLVIAADTPERATQAATLLADRGIRNYLVTERAAVVRTGSVVRQVGTPATGNAADRPAGTTTATADGTASGTATGTAPGTATGTPTETYTGTATG